MMKSEVVSWHSDAQILKHRSDFLSRHCEERSDAATSRVEVSVTRLPRYARNDEHINLFNR